MINDKRFVDACLREAKKVFARNVVKERANKRKLQETVREFSLLSRHVKINFNLHFSNFDYAFYICVGKYFKMRPKLLLKLEAIRRYMYLRILGHP